MLAHEEGYGPVLPVALQVAAPNTRIVSFAKWVLSHASTPSFSRNNDLTLRRSQRSFIKPAPKKAAAVVAKANPAQRKNEVEFCREALIEVSEAFIRVPKARKTSAGTQVMFAARPARESGSNAVKAEVKPECLGTCYSSLAG